MSLRVLDDHEQRKKYSSEQHVYIMLTEYIKKEIPKLNAKYPCDVALEPSIRELLYDIPEWKEIRKRCEIIKLYPEGFTFWEEKCTNSNHQDIKY